ncbi:Undecaprenyl phosphate N,N'-diacetylbacillosamine 1-phosphate transferase [Roseovarius albus]|uniref:Undecaprenyl phosphate N,N'-diacetylbacillosamine 1-phosphate transferase n=1 Tax=Roseovarius albus TaxID=1247867 RepID=A0A1X6YVD9_9RHOB|nr:sugar transferase [Roseovarius albus]SLN32288.1 Undecaprenyl phosphate N,N'-diacetylbacillosamine 1-phosphate transferase [Roseovarius albus]
MTVQNDKFVADHSAALELFPSRTPKNVRRGVYRHFGKRAMDIALVLLAAPIALPVVFLLAVLTAFDGGGPFYKQSRVGRNGRIFTMWKIRTMVADADEALEQYLEVNSCARREWDEMQKLSADPRITTIGAAIRKTSLDELPQLWNVLIGDMSLVGPRPMMPKQQMLYPGSTYFSMRPGISGFWQISDRNNTSFAARAGFDDLYYKSVSLAADLRVITRTVVVMLRGTGC